MSTTYAVLLCVAVSLSVSVQALTVSNTAAKYRSPQGAWLDAHDGSLVQWEKGGEYWLYAMGYGTCKEEKSGCANATLGACGFQLDHNITVFTSPTLAPDSWTMRGFALPVADRPAGIYFRPKVVFNPNTKVYVLYVNWLVGGKFSNSQYLVATSTTPEGPFKVVNDNVKMRYPVGGDFDVFVDDDGTAYFIYTSLATGHDISIEQLHPSFLASMAAGDSPKTKTPTTYSSGTFGAQMVEAPGMFKRNGVYYSLFGHTCCFCKAGSGIGVYTATKPLGRYTSRGNPGRDAKTGASITHAQQNFIAQIPDGKGDTTYVWMGDQWQSAPDHIKAHDLQYWSPLVFAADGSIEQMSYLDSFNLTVAK